MSSYNQNSTMTVEVRKAHTFMPSGTYSCVFSLSSNMTSGRFMQPFMRKNNCFPLHCTSEYSILVYLLYESFKAFLVLLDKYLEMKLLEHRVDTTFKFCKDI